MFINKFLTRQTLRKVPELTIFFWIVKLLTTALGESTSDYLVYHTNPYLAVIIGAIGLAAALILQLAIRKYIAWIYWLAVTMVAIFGTMSADVLHIVMGIPYVISTAFFAIILFIIFIVWYVKEKNLSIHTINNSQRELFYWATVMATFALGTAAGDMTAASLGLGYFTSILLFTVLIAIPALAYFLFGLNEIIAFWFAYIITRPLGASIADWLGKPYLGGLGLGDAKIALILTILTVIFVIYLTISHKDVLKKEQK